MQHYVPTVAVRREGREGFALVTALLVVLVLSVLAVGVAWVATSEQKTTFAESVHVRSLYSADAGGEAGINLIRAADGPPHIVSFADSTVHVQGETGLDGSQTYGYRAISRGREYVPGYTIGSNNTYFHYDYEISSDGRASQDGRASIDLRVTRLFKTGY